MEQATAPAIRKKIGVVVCPSDLHRGFHVSYLIWNGKMIDDPPPVAVIKVVRHYAGRQMPESVQRICRSCRELEKQLEMFLAV